MTNPALLPPERLAEIEARAEAATPAPWMRNGLTPLGFRIDGMTERVGLAFLSAPTAIVPSEADTAFIEHARADIPALLASHRALAAEVQRLESALSDALDVSEKKFIEFCNATVESFNRDGDGDIRLRTRVEFLQIIAECLVDCLRDLQGESEDVPPAAMLSCVHREHGPLTICIYRGIKGVGQRNVELRRELDAAKAEVQRLQSHEASILSLWRFLTDEDVHEIPAGKRPCGRAIGEIKNLRAEVARLGDIHTEAVAECEKWAAFHAEKAEAIESMSTSAFEDRRSKAAYWDALAAKWREARNG